MAPSPGRMHCHAAHGEGARDEGIPEREEVRVAGLEQADHHVPGDAHLMGVLGAKDAGETAREAMVGEVSRDRGGEMSLAVAGDHGINDALEGRVRGAHGDEIPEHSPQGGGRHREELAEGLSGQGPGEARTPVTPRFDACGTGRAERGNDPGEGAAHRRDGDVRLAR